VTEPQQLTRFPLPASNLAMVPRPAPVGAHERASVTPGIGPRPRRRGQRAHPAKEKGGEAEEVAGLILHMVAQNQAGNHVAAADTLKVRSAFLRHRFISQLNAFERGDRIYGRLDTVLNLASIAAGIGASLLAASKSSKGWTIILGVAIAGCQTLSQWLKPAQRAARRGRAAFELRSEAWDVLQGRDRYRGKDIDRAWDIFCDRVDKVEGREQTTEDGESSRPSTRALSGAGEPDGQ